MVLVVLEVMVVMVVMQVMVVGDRRKHLAVLLTLRSEQAKQ